MCASVFLALVSAPDQAVSETTILEPGKARAFVEVVQVDPGATIDSEEVVIDHTVPGSASASASGSELVNPDEFGTAAGTVTAGLTGHVFTEISYTLPAANLPQISPRSFLCPPYSYPYTPCSELLTFSLDVPTPITLAASGTAAGFGNATSSYSLSGTAVFDLITDSYDDPSQRFDRRFSTTLSPGTYTLGFAAHAIASEGSTSIASASLDIVMTLSPVGDCSDGLDNDRDTLVDLDDGGCIDGTDPAETTAPPVPALGAAGRTAVISALLLASLAALRARRRS
jgi:hypothetical protein